MKKYEKGKEKLESCQEEREAKKKKERSLGYVELMEGRKDGWMKERKEMGGGGQCRVVGSIVQPEQKNTTKKKNVHNG